MTSPEAHSSPDISAQGENVSIYRAPTWPREHTIYHAAHELTEFAHAIHNNDLYDSISSLKEYKTFSCDPLLKAKMKDEDVLAWLRTFDNVALAVRQLLREKIQIADHFVEKLLPQSRKHLEYALGEARLAGGKYEHHLGDVTFDKLTAPQRTFDLFQVVCILVDKYPEKDSESLFVTMFDAMAMLENMGKLTPDMDNDSAVTAIVYMVEKAMSL